jgi:Ulp1 family protease
VSNFEKKKPVTRRLHIQSMARKDLANPDEANTEVHRWTKHINIFEKKYLIIPINEE